MTLLERLVWLCVLVIGAFAWLGLVAGCGTDSHQSAQAVAVTPAPLASPSPGHRVETRSYRVCAAPGITQQVTVTTDTGPDAADWPPAEVACVDGATVTPVRCQ